MMKKEPVNMGVIIVGLVLVMVLVSVFSNDDSTENTSATEGWNEYHSKSSSYSTSYNSGNTSHSSGNRSSYWYDSPEVRKKKADDTLMKYYEYDENGNLTKKEGTIVNGKPYHKK